MNTVIAVLLLTAPPETTTLVATLTEEGDRVCKDARVEWVNPRFEAGFVRITDSKVDLEPYEGAPVVLTGRVVEDFTPKPAPESGPCPVPQMREDMVWSKSGMRLKRGGPPFPHFEVTSVRPLKELTVERHLDQLLIRFDGLEGAPTSGSLMVHYEGCYGKPGTMSQATDFEKASAKREVRMSAPTHLKKGDRTYLATSIVLRGRGEGAALALEVPLRRYDIDLECPKHGRKR